VTRTLTSLVTHGAKGRVHELVTHGLGSSFAFLNPDYVEILYPIQRSPLNTKLVFKKDSGEWVRAVKSETEWRHEIVTLRLRMKADYYRSFLAYIISKIGTSISLTTPGIYPFIRDESTNTVYLTDFSQAQRLDDRPMHVEMSITFIHSSTVAA
jgi:hypothetical protein